MLAGIMSKCLERDISVRQHSKRKHWAACHIQTPSRYDWKIVESEVKPKWIKQTNKKSSNEILQGCLWVTLYQFSLTHVDQLKNRAASGWGIFSYGDNANLETLLLRFYLMDFNEILQECFFEWLSFGALQLMLISWKTRPPVGCLIVL